MHLTWQKGGEAEVLALTGEKITLSSTIPSAPGSRIDGALVSKNPVTAGSPAGGPIRVKVASCRRQGTSFMIEGRLLDGTRELRAEIAARIAGADRR